MPVTYRKWFTITCLHDYFADGQCRALVLRPTHECRQRLARYKCMFRQTEAGGAVYYADSGDGTRLLDYQESRPLAFELASNDPLLETYTDTELAAGHVSPAQSCYYFNNIARNANTGGDTEYQLLHPPGAALAHGPILVKPDYFAYTFAAPLREAVLNVVDMAHRQKVRETRTPKEPTSSWNLNLSGAPRGRYTLNVDGQSALEFYLSNQPAVDYWGIVEIFPGGFGMTDLIPADCRLIDARGAPQRKDFAVAMSARKSIWRYHIVNDSPNHNNYDNYTVVGSCKDSSRRRDIPFARVQSHPSLAANELLFESREILPLRQEPSREHVFSFKPAGRGTSVGLKLPYALARNTRLDIGSGSPQMCSDIFVYL